MAKQKYYSCAAIKKKNAQYNIVLGERANGKSYAIKHDAFADAWNDDNKRVILLRRYDIEARPSLILQYFGDLNMTAISSGAADTVVIYRGEIWAALTAENDKAVRVRKLGYVRALNCEGHYTSGSYLDVSTIIFEEFVSRDKYLPKEPNKLQQFVSTVARRRKIRVWLIGNTISRICPYFTEWELRNIPNQKQGTIDVYKHLTEEIDEDGKPVSILIAVENAANSGRNSKMFFGSVSKMITSGVWQSEEQPHLQGVLEDYEIIHTVIFQQSGFKFLMRLLVDKDGVPIWYVVPKYDSIKDGSRVVSDLFSMSPMYTVGFHGITPQEQKAFNLILENKVVFSDNMCGTDFNTVLKSVLR